MNWAFLFKKSNQMVVVGTVATVVMPKIGDRT